METADLKNTSPATVSRCAIIYFPKESIPIKSIFNSWLMKLPPILHDQRRRLDMFFNYFMTPILSTFMTASELMYQVSPPWAIHTFTMILDGLIHDYRNAKYKDERHMNKVMEKLKIADADQDVPEDKAKIGIKETLVLGIRKQETLEMTKKESKTM